MHDLSKVVESKPEGHRTRGASRPAGRGRTNFLALVFAAVTLTTGACGDDGSDNVVDTSADAEPDADAEATGGSGHDMTGGSEGEEHDCAAEDWETGEFPGDETTGDVPGGETTGDVPGGETSGDVPGGETSGDVPEGETTGGSGDETSSSSGVSEEPDDPAGSLCTRTGGTVSVHFCCGAVDDFPSSCAIGACGCSPENSHEVKTCECPAGQCFDPAVGCIDNF